MAYSVGVLASGNGTNLQALIDGFHLPGHGRIVVVASDNPRAHALERARQANIPCVALLPEAGEKRVAYHKRLAGALREYNIDLLVLAGYMRLLPGEFLQHFPRVINVHPALLPAFPGLDAPAQALAYGVKVTGCTVHLVDEGVDSGPVLLQKSLEILQGETPDQLHQRLKPLEHQLLVRAVQAFARGRVKIKGRQTWIKDDENES